MTGKVNDMEGDSMQSRLFKRILRGLGLASAMRGVSVRPDDVFIVSYPRSGNTWFRFLMANLLHPDTNVDFTTIEGVIPDIYKNPDRRLRRLPSPRYLKSHEYFDPRYPKVIYLVRDPRAVSVSYYHYLRKARFIPDNFGWESFLPRFLDGTSYLPIGNWHDNVNSWLSSGIGDSRLLMLRYEDLQAEPVVQLERVSAFLGRPRREDLIADAVQKSDRRRMMDLERTQSDKWRTTRSTRQDIPFVRSTVDAWRDELPKWCFDEITSRWAPLMAALGYKV